MLFELMKPALREPRDLLAQKLREIRREDRAKAKLVLAKFKAGIAHTERMMLDNLYYSTRMSVKLEANQLLGSAFNV